MKDLLKVGLGLALTFIALFVSMRFLGLLPEDQLMTFLENTRSIHPAWLVAAVVLLLWFDIIIAVPTLATVLLAGFFLGPVLGAAASIAGLMAMGFSGYGFGRIYGRKALAKLFKGDEARVQAIDDSFARNDMLVLFVCQAIPILPELSCCLAGIAKMRFGRFLLGYMVGVAPFAVIASYAGSISTASNPMPAVYAAVGLTTSLLLVWTAVQRLGRRRKST
jgi:uncharacterized membrane protein YdjX (TVP38/TMEM64 family)